MSDIKSAIEAANGNFMNSFSRKDAAALAACYTADAQLLPANSDVVEGTEAIKGFWKSVMDMGMTGATLVTQEVEAHGETAIEVGRYKLFAGDKTADHGKYVVVWKHDAHAWKLHRDIWTTSQPVAAGV